jgi:hypothetical protein
MANQSQSRYLVARRIIQAVFRTTDEEMEHLLHAIMAMDEERVISRTRRFARND